MQDMQQELVQLVFLCKALEENCGREDKGRRGSIMARTGREAILLYRILPPDVCRVVTT